MEYLEKSYQCSDFLPEAVYRLAINYEKSAENEEERNIKLYDEILKQLSLKEKTNTLTCEDFRVLCLTYKRLAINSRSKMDWNALNYYQKIIDIWNNCQQNPLCFSNEILNEYKSSFSLDSIFCSLSMFYQKFGLQNASTEYLSYANNNLKNNNLPDNIPFKLLERKRNVDL